MRWILVMFLFVCAQAYSQCKTYIIGVRHDTLNCTDNNNLKQGKWVVKVAPLRGEPGYEEEGVFKDGVKEGVWRMYSMQGDVLAIENYKWGFKNGVCDYYDMWGLVREESWKATNPENPYDTVEVPDLNDDTKIYLKVVKMKASTIEHGTWTFYDSQRGTITKVQAFVLGQRVDPITGKPLNGQQLVAYDSTAANKNIVKTVPKEVSDYDKKNNGKKKIKVRDGATD